MFQGYFKGVPMKYLECFKEVSRGLRVFQGNLRGVPRDLQAIFEGASRISKRSSKDVSSEFQRCFSRMFKECLS